MHATLPLLQGTDFPTIYRNSLDTLQVNLGYKCNQSCIHCHVNAGPTRKEMMARESIDLIVQVLKKRNIRTLDLTGGAPELHDDFRYLVEQATGLGVHVIDRCNLTILFEEKQEGLAKFLAKNRVEVVASLPCYSSSDVDKQRGKGVFSKSIAGLQQLNALGYGKQNNTLLLNLVYNPQGATLPGSQSLLEEEYKRELAENFGVEFNQLYTITNMPINRFGSMLVSKGQFDGYMRLLKDNYQVENLEGLMCKSQVSVDWQGFLYDCDFNQQLGLNLAGDSRRHLRDLLIGDMDGKSISIADHCFACTAGQGSSCGGEINKTVSN
jgi:radical SAM/Cys-rich protein